jgi:hypothetical protein
MTVMVVVVDGWVVVVISQVLLPCSVWLEALKDMKTNRESWNNYQYCTLNLAKPKQDMKDTLMRKEVHTKFCSEV